MKIPPGTDARGHKLDYWIKCCEEGSFDQLLAWSPDWGNAFLKGPKMLREKADSGPESGSRVMMICKGIRASWLQGQSWSLLVGRKLKRGRITASATCELLCGHTKIKAKLEFPLVCFQDNSPHPLQTPLSSLGASSKALSRRLTNLPATVNTPKPPWSCFLVPHCLAQVVWRLILSLSLNQY